MNKYIVDTTLRDGEQAPGVMFTSQQKIEIAFLLDRLGIDEVEVGTPAMGYREQKDIRAIAKSGFNFKTTAWCRALKSDIDAAASCETDAVSISFPVSKVQLDALDKNIKWVEDEMPILVAYAKERFESVYVGFQDATRCDIPTLKHLTRLANSLDVQRVRIADTVGIMTPVTTTKLFDILHASFPETDFEYHAHNDLGMATANAFVALESGASGVSVTVNGLGERAGNVALEELLVAQHLSENESRYELASLKELSHVVEQASKQQLSVAKPIVGEHAFAHETGIHVNSILKNKMSYQAFDESLVGVNSNKILIGKHSGRHAYINYYKAKGMPLNSEQVEAVYKTAQQFIFSMSRNPDEEDMLDLYDRAINSSSTYV